ncbi:MAG TPA: glycosyltransferase [Ghiorsea sp.]|nr:glycosyltransferase [Ghiorsea sp.]HIP07543.1 glycosyltransferase [Mariprofundaceae bacterium]
MNNFAVSILIISRDRRDLLCRVLGDLRAQQYDGEFEIVVVEETDDPQAPIGVSYVSHPMKNLGIAYARNLSLEHAKHDILVFIDDDCRVDSDWLTKLVTPLKDEKVLGVQGGVTVPDGTNGIGWAESLLGFPGGGITRVIQAEGQTQDTKEISTLNACYRKSAVMKAGGFSNHARFGGEDYLLAKQVAGKGKLLFTPLAQVQHEARGHLPAIWTWFVRRGRAEYDLWQSGLAPQGYGVWMLRSSLLLKLLPLMILCYWSVLPLILFLLFLVVVNRWRFRWVLQHKNIPTSAWLWLPWVRLVMGAATDIGRVKSWAHWK